MKLFLYYAFCSVKNQIKKLFRSWVIIFLLVCVLVGGVIGGVIGIVAADIEDGNTENGGAESGEAEPSEEEPIFDFDTEDAVALIECAVAVITLIVFFFGVFNADKSGSSIFSMPDVNLLFSAPMKPQSVLLFKLTTQIFLLLFASVYLAIQVPTLVAELKLGAFVGAVMVFAWILILVYQRLINIFLYILASMSARVKKMLLPTSVGALAVLAVAYLFCYRSTGSCIEAAKVLFANPASRCIPIYGWIKGAVAWAAEGKIFLSVVALLLLFGGAFAFAFGIWHMKPDFYEEALSKSQKTAEALTSAQSGTVAKRSKERPDRIERDGMKHGCGANVFFFKSLYNRKRFAYLGFFTKTSVLYLVLAVGVALILRISAKTSSFIPIGLGLCVIVFLRSMGDPLASDMEKSCFVTVPASAHEKILWSLLSGSVDCALDTLPAVVLSAAVLGASPLSAFAFWLLALSIDFYAENAMLFTELTLPASVALQIKQMVTVLFIYFGLIPIAAVLLIGFIVGLFEPFIFIASAAALVIGTVFFCISPLFLERGRK